MRRTSKLLLLAAALLATPAAHAAAQDEPLIPRPMVGRPLPIFSVGR